jgi:Domain of unknown function (DUF6456)
MKPIATANPQSGGDKDALVFLLRAPHITGATKSGRVRLQAQTEKLDISGKVIGELAQSGFVVRRENRIVLTPAGREMAELFLARRDIEIASASAQENGHHQGKLNAINRAESPLGALYARVTASGGRFLTKQEFEAGERLRLDFTKGMLMPRVSANWHTSVSAGRRSGESNGVLDLTDAALAARQRVEKAMAALGGELGGVATDICCFLKGFEQVELERKWPKRSAKFMLKASLSVLALHYWPRMETKVQIRHWGTGDFKPGIGGSK